jgi:flagella basal body P-ring formation protein FlgA
MGWFVPSAMKTLLALSLAAATCLTGTECPAQNGAADSAPAAEQALRQKLVSAYPTVSRWEITLLPSATEVTNDVAATHPSVTVTRLGGRSAVWVGSKDLGEHRHGTLLWFTVAGFAPAVAAAHPLTAGAPLDTQDVALVERDIVGSDCKPLDNPTELTGMRVKRLVRTGELLCETLLEPVPPVARGQEVTLRYTARSFTLTARGVAQADGLIGKRVTVRNSSSGEIFAATVTGNGEVSVDE